MSTRFCIVIPTYNARPTLPAAVESALNQEFSDYSVFVSDNGSADGSSEYLSGLRHGRLSVAMHRDVLGKTENWNRAFREAPEAEYFTMLHSDDVLYPQALAQTDRALRRTKDASLIYGASDMLWSDGTVNRKHRPWPLGYTANAREFRRLQALSNAVSVVGVTFSRAHFFAAQGFSPQFTFLQDVDFFERLTEYGPAAFVPAALGQYRQFPLNSRARISLFIEQCVRMQPQLENLPAWLRQPTLAAVVDVARRELGLHSPEKLADFDEFLRKQRILDLSGKTPVWFSSLTFHRAYKAWLTVKTIFR